MSNWITDAVGQAVYEGDRVAYVGGLMGRRSEPEIRTVEYIGLALDNKIVLEPTVNQSPRRVSKVAAHNVIKIHEQVAS